MKFTRKAKANWQGSGKDGKGTLSTQSTVLNNSQYSFSTRFEDGIGTNPEELIAAAHSGCFTMKLSFLLGEAGFTPGNLDTEARVTFEDGRVSNIHLELKGQVEGISEDKFRELSDRAKAECPISMLLNTNITLSASLV
ncbi:MAG: OsmC family protein [Marinilabiliaceae bacterium]|jgi:osmotically inducible protein OsmC|nr:OsmC family protein [Marinilabiliaceae bacterium]